MKRICLNYLLILFEKFRMKGGEGFKGGNKMEKFGLPEGVKFQTLAIFTKHLDEMVHFYKNVIGFTLISEENNLSFFGLREKDEKLFILEETKSSPFSRVGKLGKLAHFSLMIPTEEEFVQVVRRAAIHQYPIDRLLGNQQGKRAVFTDPDGNQVEVAYRDFTKPRTEEMPIVLAQLLQAYPATSRISLPEGVYFNRLTLNVAHHEDVRAFYEEILEVVTDRQQAHQPEKFYLYLEDRTTQTFVEEPENDKIGLDFVVMIVTQEDLILLAEHLTKKEIKFFIDKKQTILTLFDPNEIEWWFVLKMF